MTTSGTPSHRVTAKCVNGPCVGRAYLFGSSNYAAPFNATGQAYRLHQNVGKPRVQRAAVRP
jgi:hypothetical protein